MTIGTKAPNGERVSPEARRMIAELEIQAEASPRMCCARIGHGAWCNLLDGHRGDHVGAAPEYGPLEAFPKVWQSTKGKIK